MVRFFRTSLVLVGLFSKFFKIEFKLVSISMFLLLAAAPNVAAAESGLDLASSLAQPAFGVCSFTYILIVITKF